MLPKKFDATNPNFLAMILVAIFGLAAAAGIQFPQSPEDLAGNVVNTFTQGGYFSLIGVLSISIIMPVWNFVREKEYPSLREFFSRVNTITYLIFLVFALIGLFGVPLVYTSIGDIAIAIYTKDWGAVVSLVFTAVLNPLFRYFMDRRERIQAEEK